MPYIKDEAAEVLSQIYGWKPFSRKHFESRFTRFYEDYWLPKRFGFDKRRAHFSSLIMTKQLSRKLALKRIEKTEMSPELRKKEFAYIAKKLAFSELELKVLFKQVKEMSQLFFTL